jgi:hypothetical protein
VRLLSRVSMFGISCIGCGHELIAPEESAYLDTGLIRHFWRCPKCHAYFKSIPRFPRDAPVVRDLKSKVDVSPLLREE